MFQNKKKLQSESEVFYSWGWTWLPYLRVLRQYSSPASLAYADFLSALPPIWSAQVSLQVQTDGFKTKKNFRANLKFFIAGVGLGFHISASCVNIPARLHLLTQTSCLLFLPFGRRKFRFKSKQMDLKQKKTSERI